MGPTTLLPPLRRTSPVAMQRRQPHATISLPSVHLVACRHRRLDVRRQPSRTLIGLVCLCFRHCRGPRAHDRVDHGDEAPPSPTGPPPPRALTTLPHLPQPPIPPLRPVPVRHQHAPPPTCHHRRRWGPGCGLSSRRPWHHRPGRGTCATRSATDRPHVGRQRHSTRRSRESPRRRRRSGPR